MDSDEEETMPSWKGVPGYIVLINAYDPLQNKSAEKAYIATCQMIKQCLRSSSSHNIGVYLYGTKESKSSSFGLQNIIELLPLAVPMLDSYKTLKNTDISTYGQAKELIMSDVLWLCNKVFANCKKTLLTKMVVILSKLDIPPVESDQKQVFKRVGDLIDMDIEIKIINVSQNEYPIHEFYENFLIDAHKENDIILRKPIWDSKQIEEIMCQPSHRHLAVAQLKFEIGNGLSIGVGVYNLLKRTGHSLKTVNLDRETNEVVTSVTRTKKITIRENSDYNIVDDEENASKEVPLLKSEILYYQEYGGEKVEFTDDEMKVLKNPFGPPLLKLLGFKPARIICKEKWFLKACHFLFPNENIIEGSTLAFKSLHRACKDMNVVAICVLCTRVNAKPSIVALSPTENPLGLDIDIGFDIIHLPFLENVRQLSVEEDDETQVSEAHQNLMKKILSSVHFDYEANMFENPKVQSEFRAIETIALDEKNIESFTDTTKPEPEKFQKINSDSFEEIFGPFGVVAPKRPTAFGIAAKKAKLDFDMTSLANHIENQTVNNYTVPQLKQILKLKDIYGLPALTGLKKNELVELVYKHSNEIID